MHVAAGVTMLSGREREGEVGESTHLRAKIQVYQESCVMNLVDGMRKTEMKVIGKVLI